jgi:hypothetical protein
MDNSLGVILMQLATRAPILIVHVVGLVLAIAWWRRYPKPCLLVFLAMGIALVNGIASVFVNVYLPRAWGGTPSAGTCGSCSSSSAS